MGDGWFAFGVYEAMRDHPCLVCGVLDGEKPMAFRGEDYCSDNHRKVIIGEREPTEKQKVTMDPELFLRLFPKGLPPVVLSQEAKTAMKEMENINKPEWIG